MDVAFLLDASKASLFDDMKDFVKAFSHKFVVEPHATRIALVTYGYDSSIIFGFTRYCCRKELDEALNKLDYPSFVARRTETNSQARQSETLLKRILKRAKRNSTRLHHSNSSRRLGMIVKRNKKNSQDLVEKQFLKSAYKKDDSTSAVVLGRGLQTALGLFRDPTVRTGVPHVLIVVSYSPSADNFQLPSSILRHEGVDIFGVGVGKFFSKKQLLHLASFPKFRHLFKVETSSQLKCLAAHVADKVIRGTMQKFADNYFRILKSFTDLCKFRLQITN